MRNLKSPITAVIFDADDTLWECNKHYVDTWSEFVEEEVERTGLDKKFISDIFHFFDGKMVQLPGGFEKDRFPRAFYVTAIALDSIMEKRPNLHRANQAFSLGNTVYDAEYKLYPGVKDMLERMAKEHPGMLMIAQTKGPQQIQLGKFRRNGIEDIFDKIYIRGTKTEDDFKEVLADFDLRPEEVLCVGDSMKDDVVIPRNIGCRTVWVCSQSFDTWKPKWAYENDTKLTMPDWKVDSIAELLDIEIPFMQATTSLV